MDHHAEQRVEAVSAGVRARMLRRLTVATVMLALSLGTAATGASAQDEGPAGSATPIVVSSSASSDSDLAALFPSSISGVPVDVVTWAGPDWIARYDPGVSAEAAAIEATEMLVASAGATLDDLTIATSLIESSPGNFTTIAAVRIPGSPAIQQVDPLVDAMVGFIREPVLAWASISDRWVALVRDEGMPGTYPVTTYFVGDTAWVVQADRPLLDAIIAALPPREEPPAAGSFDSTGSLAEARALHTATLLPDGRVLVVGGVDSTVARIPARHIEGSRPPIVGRATAEIWDPTTGEFSATGPMMGPRARHTATLLADGRVLVVGGDQTGSTSAEVWDSATGEFSQTGSLARGRIQHTATLLPDGRVLVVGGLGADSALSSSEVPRRLLPQASAEIWDPATGSFTPAGSLAEPRADHAAILVADGRVTILGEWLGGRRLGLGTVETWDPASETFSTAGSLAGLRWGPEAVLLPDGRIFVVGGVTRSVDAELWDPDTGRSVPAVPRTSERVALTATALPDGRVLVIGGTKVSGPIGSIPLAETQAWDAATGDLAPAGPLAETRMEHTATLLPDGRVLVIGGLGDDITGGLGEDGWVLQPALTSAELWKAASE